MKSLLLIPARGGSKGVPHKNIKLLAGRPLIAYSIDVAREIVADEDICLSTDDETIKYTAEMQGLHVPFIRPDYLSTDTATTYDVIMHALDFYAQKGIQYDAVVLLQPTSPLRTAQQVKEAMDLFSPDMDMVVSVKQSHAATVICNENEEGFLEFTLNKRGLRRQDLTNFYEYNGAIYVMNVASLRTKAIPDFSKTKKYLMSDLTSIDIDTEIDFIVCESQLLNKV